MTPGAFGQDGTRSDGRGAPTREAVPDGLAANDWTGIREVYEAGRHAVYAAEDGHQARNPGQRWRTRFDGRGFLIEPDAGGWSWGLELERYGFAGRETEVASPVRGRAEGGRVVYEWDDTLEEWYVNDQRGLEHGYMVHRRPVRENEDDGSPLIISLAVRGDLHPEVLAGRRGVRFRDGGGVAVLTYTGLTVLDAEGRELEASFERIGARLRLLVDERNACYPLTIDPVAQQAYLKASNTDVMDSFGWSVAISGDTVVVGTFREDSSATGVNGDQSDNSAPESGAAYVFVRNGTSWSQQAYLKASNTELGDQFGKSVAVSADTVVVGAPYECSDADGVNGDQSDNSAYRAGAAYVFARNGTSWSQQAYLKSSNSDPEDRFGDFVAVSGDTVAIGARGERSSATGVNGDQSDNSGRGVGAAYVFVRSVTSWSQQAYLKASNAEDGDAFGSVAVSGDTVVVGAIAEDSHATGVNGDESDNSAFDSGAAYVFVRNGTGWSQQAYLKASNTDADDEFADAVSLSGDTAVVGARMEASRATGVNGDQNDNSALGSGAAYVFVRNGTSWGQEAYLKASNAERLDAFGRSVAVAGDTVIVGARNEDSSATGVNGDGNDNSAEYAGAAYVFVQSGTAWSQQAYLKASNTDADDLFGFCVAASGGMAVVGAISESSDATGVNGSQGDNSAYRSGAAYVFDLESDPVADFSATPTSGDEDLFVTFSDLSAGTGLSSWDWTFGDGGSSTLRNPTHLYFDPGTYTVSLTVTGTNGIFTETKDDYIVVHDVTEAAATPYNGSGVNPNVFASTSLPILGTTWTSLIDGGSLGASGMTMVFGYSAPLSGFFVAAGEVLVDPTSPWRFTIFAFGASGISNHNLPIPSDPTLAGIHSYVQGFLNNVGGSGQLTNAYDLELGN